MRLVDMKGAGGVEVLHLTDGPIPTPKENEILIEVHAAGVNRPDLAQRKGLYPPPPGASPVLGLEVAGLVKEVGKRVSDFKVGDPVCALMNGGGYSEYCVVAASQCLPVPKGWSMTEAAGLPETYFTVWQNIFQIGQLRAGERVLIHGGASGIGTTAIQLARAFGAEVFVTAGTAEKCAACIQLGANHAINYKEASFSEEIMRLTSNQGVNVILDMVGGDYTEKNIECSAPGGRIVQIATQKGMAATINLMKIMQKRLVLTGSTLRPRTLEEKGKIAQELREKVWPLLDKKQVKVIVDRVFPLADVRKAHEYLEKGEHFGKVILSLR